jgi:ATP-dependent DNA helicase RecG
VLFEHKKFQDMDRKERLNACFWHCVLRYVTNQKMNNKSLRERFNLPGTKVEVVSGIIDDTKQEERIKLADPLNTSRRYANYVPYWA